MTVGHPIGQVKSPEDITKSFSKRHVDALHIPLEVTPNGIDQFLRAINECTNVDGLVMTIPYKFKGAALCSTISDRAELLGAANILRRNKDGSWHGDMTDGVGFCNAIEKAGTKINNRKTLLIGAGGAGSAIGLELLDRGASALGIHDIDSKRASRLVRMLKERHPNKAHTVGGPNPAGFDIIAHASPTGMNPNDPFPLKKSELEHLMHVGDVVTEPEVTPLIRFARDLGCNTHTGIQMWKGHQETAVDFLLNQN